MITVEQYGPVTAIRMARGLFGRPICWTAAYWVDGLLIDSGPRCTADQLLRVLRDVAVEQIVVTHAHEDHIGGLAALRERYPSCKIFASRDAIPLIEEPVRQNMQRYRRLLWGVPAAVDQVTPLDEVDDRISTERYQFRVIETPGHTAHHVSLYEAARRWIFAGDTFVGGYERAWSPESDLFNLIGSLRTFIGLKPERIFTGSGSVRRAPLPDLHEKISYLTEMATEVAEMAAVGLTQETMVRRLFREEPAIRYWSFGHYSGRNLVDACRAYNALVLPSENSSSGATAARAHRWLRGSSANRSAGKSGMVR